MKSKFKSNYYETRKCLFRDSLFITQGKKNQSTSWKLMLEPRVELTRHQLLIAGELPDISHWKRDTRFQLRIIVCFLVLYYFHFNFIPANPAGSSDFFF